MGNAVGRALHILVVDDHPDSVEALVKLLTVKGFVAVGVCSFAAGVAAARAERFDLILCDIGMPEHDGYELLVAVKAIAPIRAFALTGYGMATDIRNIADAGFDDYFLKPFDVAKLLTAIDRVSNEIAAARPQRQLTTNSRQV